MWAFASRRFRTYLLFAIGAPVAGWVLNKVGDEIEQRTGETSVTRTLHKTRDVVRRVERGPLARRI